MSDSTDTALANYRLALATLAAAEAASAKATAAMTAAEIAMSETDREESEARYAVVMARKELDAALVGVACDD